MLEIRTVEPLEGRLVRLTLSDGTVVERDLTELLDGPVFDPIARDDDVFRSVHVDYGTLVRPGNVDIAPETLIWDGPYPRDEATRRPERFPAAEATKRLNSQRHRNRLATTSGSSRPFALTGDRPARSLHR